MSNTEEQSEGTVEVVVHVRIDPYQAGKHSYLEVMTSLMKKNVLEFMGRDLDFTNSGVDRACAAIIIAAADIRTTGDFTNLFVCWNAGNIEEAYRIGIESMDRFPNDNLEEQYGATRKEIEKAIQLVRDAFERQALREEDDVFEEITEFAGRPELIDFVKGDA